MKATPIMMYLSVFRKSTLRMWYLPLTVFL
ncbi:hypothetical protein CPAR01_11498 [Colletotrichum paranaense]|uniref:Uncharacterized protein n=1 Tax=Colletotrichum paranaense TaxID=1914294 RepID=A0ABQ9SC17_9PEZI|nr:uncharacterized protein CPAR01_11498 [Colletotrichum paranaense]KAK1531849.1 hypothetical protein CPAR01_11498 [Colletotrichum paranaense]